MNIIRSLSDPRWAKLQMLVLIQLTYIYNPFRQYFAKVYRKCLSEAERKRLGGSYEGITPLLGFSRQNRFMIMYKRFSGCYMIYVVIRSFLPIRTLIEPFNLNMPPHCFILGRFMMFGPFPKDFGALICMYHLFWRFSRGRLDKHSKLELGAFLLHNEERVKLNYHREGEEFKKNELSSFDAYVTILMYYLVQFKGKIVYRLRPNRSKRARDNLLLHSSFVSIFLFIFMGTMVLLCAPSIIYSAANDIQYVQDYPGCTPFLDRLYRDKQLYWYSVTPNLHRIISGIFDAMENIFIWWDNLIAAGCALALPYILNQDLLIYWHYLHRRVKKLVLRAQLDRVKRERKRLSGRQWHSTVSVKLDILDIYYEEKSIEIETREIQYMLHDFFMRIKYADTYVSAITTMSMLIWLSYFSCRAYLQITQPEQKTQIFTITFFTCIISVVMLALSHIIFAFRRDNLKTYILICSLMAYDTSSHKTRYMPILEYYTEKNRATYTIQDRPYTPSTLLTIVSWSFSCAAIVESFAKRSIDL